MGKGIIGLIQFAVTFAFAAPVALLGMEKLLAGSSFIGTALIATGIGMLVIEEHITRPSDVPMSLLQRLTGAAVATPDEDASEPTDE